MPGNRHVRFGERREETGSGGAARRFASTLLGEISGSGEWDEPARALVSGGVHRFRRHSDSYGGCGPDGLGVGAGELLLDLL